jgi:hypothetical protein
MKKLFLPLLLVGAVTQAKAQFSFDAQLKYASSTTALFNKNISDLGASQDYDFAFSSNYGAALSVNFGKIGLGVEALAGNFKGAYQGEPPLFLGSTYTSEVELKTLQIPVYLRVGGSKGSFGEFGVVANNISAATYSASHALVNPAFDVTDQYQSFLAYMVGVGGRISLPKIPVMLSISARFMYSTADAKGVDALGIDLDNYSTYYKTNAASVGLHAGLVYSFE